MNVSSFCCHACQVAEAMGVVSMRRNMLAQTADSMQLGMESMEAFGQSEALTTRLKHIIDAYADGPGILLELVQNAGGLLHACMCMHAWMCTLLANKLQCCRLLPLTAKLSECCGIADDAGATEVALLLDEEQYACNSILGASGHLGLSVPVLPHGLATVCSSIVCLCTVHPSY